MGLLWPIHDNLDLGLSNLGLGLGFESLRELHPSSALLLFWPKLGSRLGFRFRNSTNQASLSSTILSSLLFL